MRVLAIVAPALLGAVVLPRPDFSRDSFVAVSSQPVTGGVAFLNDAVAIDFTNPVDLSTANLNTVRFTALDLRGMPVAEVPSGVFRLGKTPGDPIVGRRLLFEPALPTNNTFSNGGFRPDRIYVVDLPAGSSASAVLRDTSGMALARAFTFRFSTPNGTLPSQLFRNPAPGGPARSGFGVTSVPNDRYLDGIALLNKSGQSPVTVELAFDQALNPHSDNVPVALDLDPTVRSIATRGRIYLEYDDTDPALGNDVWIPASVSLVSNGARGAEVQLHPLGVLPNNADIRVIVEATLEDISGESSVASPSYSRVFATFRTVRALEPQFDALVETFDTTEWIDPEAPLLEPPAEIGPGFVKAGFDFEGQATVLDYRPAGPEVILNTDFTQITPVGAPPINVAGGVFQFRNVTIPAGVTVRGTGTNPMVWLVTGDFTVDGTLSVSGGDGESVTTTMAANFPAAGGIGNCGGGNGGRGSPNTGGRSSFGEAGFGPGQRPGGGGGGGALGVGASCGRGSGGGGGSFATQGDPYYPVVSPGGTQFVQQLGRGGFGCLGPSGAASRTLPPGAAGPLAFADGRPDNDYWGVAVNVQRQLRITGELAEPAGGAGGGGGGDYAGGPLWVGDNRGGGGGGGGGVLIVKVLGDFNVGAGGRITADGGDGGGGEEAGGNTKGGGGGGGSGGMVVVMAGGKIRVEVHGETYARGDTDFAISADGGVGVQGAFGGASWSGKYPPPATPSEWDNNPAGGFGGLGVVQLMAPAGDDSVDGTGTVLDDNIELVRNGVALRGTEKQRYLAWRGLPNDVGVWVADNNLPTYNNPPATPGYPPWASGPADEGDFRPAPALLPAPYGHKSRVRSRWIDVGVGAVRLPVQQFGATGPRRIAEDPARNLLAGPRYEFSGTNADSAGPKRNWVGYIDYQQAGGGIQLVFPAATLPGPTPPVIAAIYPNAKFQRRAAYRIALAQPSLGTVRDRYSQHQARLRDAGSGMVLGSYRIVGHDDRTLWLSPDGPLPPPGPTLRLEIVAQSFQVITGGAAGLGPTRIGPTGRVMPQANVRIGIAFHRDPSQALAAGTDPNRFPNAVGTFVHDLADPAVQEQIRTFQGGAAFCMWDLLFNTAFSEDDPGQILPGLPLTPSPPRPELHWLVVPYRF